METDRKLRPITVRTLFLLVFVALLGGVIGGAATFWAAANLPPARSALLGTPTPLPTATLWPLPTPLPTATATASRTPTAVPTATTAPTPTAIPSLTDLVAAVRPAVVLVINTHDQRASSGLTVKDLVWGSGVIVDDRGYVLTNEHVAAGAQTLVVSLADGRDMAARYVAGDAAADLALLKIERAGRYASINWGDSAVLRLGEGVLAIGSPLGNLPGSVTTGVISGLDRTVTVEDRAKMTGLIQTDAAINHGNSGGGLFNLRGELVGIVTLIIRTGKLVDTQEIQGVGFAVASANARPLVQKWLATATP